MTFSLVARDRRSGAFGMVVASSSPAVASRCIHLRSGLGVVASQNVTNPALGDQTLDAMAEGMSAREALLSTLATEAYPRYRQLSIIDNQGRTAHHSGEESLGINHHILSDSAVGAGNLLASPQTITAMVEGFQNSFAQAFERRLLDGLAAAMTAGGEAGPVRSAGIKVVDNVAWATTDLRVDDTYHPIDELQRLWDLWQPQKDAYRLRAIDPTQAPSYGVPGDE